MPFVSIPTSSLMDLGSTLGTPLTSLIGINWPTVLTVGVAIIGAAILLPQLATALAGIVSTLTAPPASSSPGGRYTQMYARALEGKEISCVGSVLTIKRPDWPR